MLLHLYSTASTQWSVVRIMRPPPAAAYLPGGLHRHSTEVAKGQLCDRPLALNGTRNYRYIL